MVTSALVSLFLLAAGAGECADAVEPQVRKAEERVVFGTGPTGSQLWSAVGGDYVLCELDRGNVSEVLYLEGGAAVAVLADGTRVQFSLPVGREAWFVARTVDAGATVAASESIDIDTDGRVDAETSRGTHPAGILVLLLSGVGGVALFVRWRQQRHTRVAVGGTAAGGRVKRSDIPETRFSDVAGCAEAVEDLREMVDILQHPENFAAVGARTPKGALLVGPPGTGKTLLARAVAGEAGVPFFSAAGSDFVEMYVGVGARRVRDVFEKARKAGGGIVFIDEIDAVGRRRSEAAVSGGEVETENTLIALLNELDGFTGSNVIVLAATNRADILDPALCRPGRLDRRVYVGLPDVAGREEILRVHMRGKPLDGVDLAAVARRTPGMSGAQLEQVCNEAALLAARDGRVSLVQGDLSSAVEYVVMGRARRSARVTEHDRAITAWHEAGHAVCALLQPEADRPVAVSIVPRGEAGGVTWMSAPDSQMLTRAQLRARLVVALGGRAAEEMLLDGEHTAGAAGDLEQASSIARLMVDRFGMTDRGLAVRHNGSDTSEEEVEHLLSAAQRDARRLLSDHRGLVEALVGELLNREDLDEADLARLAAAHT